MNRTPRRRIHALAALVLTAGTAVAVLATVRAGIAASGSPPNGEALAKGSDCFACHAVGRKVVGPAFDAVAGKFAGQPGAQSTLEGAIKNGHVGTWGEIPMPPHPKLGAGDIKQIVSWILSLKSQKTGAATPGAEKTNGSAAPAEAKTYSYSIKGKTVTTHVPIFQPGTNKVTPSVFHGYEIYNSYCFRCHGEDALGSLYAPDLRRALNQGMTRQQFLAVAMEGRKAKGMPSWAGFLSPKDIRDIYAYVKARSIGAVAAGEPQQ